MYSHHPWCNFFGLPRDGCQMCERFFTQYPIEGKTADELLRQHFPEVAEMNQNQSAPSDPSETR